MTRRSPTESQELSWVPFSTQLRKEVDALEKLSEELLDASGIEYRGDFNRGGGVLVIAPDWAWTNPTDDLRRIQMKVVPRFDEWRERYKLLFRTAPKELQKQVDETASRIRAWLARDGGRSGWDVPENIAAAKAKQAERFAKLRELLDIVAPESAEAGAVIALPDTSALIDVPELGQYIRALRVSSAELILAPAVLSELDSLKDQGKTQEVREKARIAVRAIKAVRERGSLLLRISLQSERPFRSDPNGGFGVFEHPSGRFAASGRVS